MVEKPSKQLKRDLEKLKRRAKKIDEMEKELGREVANRARDRLMLQVLKRNDEYNLELDAAALNLDKQKYRMLQTFRDECLIPRFDDCFVEGEYIEDLKQAYREIRQMGEIFETLGLAKPRKGFSWVPREKLCDIVEERISATRETFNIETSEGLHHLNLATVRAYLEVADVAAFIVTVMSAVGVETGQDGGWKANSALRKLLISASVNSHFTAVASTTFLAPKLQIVR